MTTPKRLKQVTSISQIVGDRPNYDGRYCVDSCDRTWKIIQKHSGCALKGANIEAEIPYWTCYYIGLPGLTFTGKERIAAWKEEKPTLLEELLKLSAKDGDLIRDERNTLLWIVKVSEYGLSLDGYDDNHWLPMKTLGVLSLGKLRILSTKEQRIARRLEHKPVESIH